VTTPDRLCVCGDTEAEHAGDGTCAYCECPKFVLDKAAMADQAELDELLNGLSDMGVIIASDGRSSSGGGGEE